ncbi:MAG: hypothetical protein KIT60_17890 [Burkholderiaceae bacterium]|nr:hypothetical protein [Burkholderiaceae bacterium]
MATETPFPTASAETAQPAGPDVTRSSPIPSAGADGAVADTAARTDDLIGRIAQSAHETIDRLAETAAPHVSRLQGSLSGDALHQRADQVRELRDEWTESLRETVRENPLAAVGIALAVGVLVARLTRE